MYNSQPMTIHIHEDDSNWMVCIHDLGIFEDIAHPTDTFWKYEKFTRVLNNKKEAKEL